jgi:hypothetical protein
VERQDRKEDKMNAENIKISREVFISAIRGHINRTKRKERSEKNLHEMEKEIYAASILATDLGRMAGRKREKMTFFSTNCDKNSGCQNTVT